MTSRALAGTRGIRDWRDCGKNLASHHGRTDRYHHHHHQRQVRTAKGLTEAPGAVPLLARGGKIPVGGTIRTIGHHWDPVFALPASACARHMVNVGATGSGKTNLMIWL